MARSPTPTQMENEMDYPITPDDEFRANFLEEKLKKSHDLAQSLADALDSIARNTCCGGCQEAAKVAKAALANYRKGES